MHSIICIYDRAVHQGQQHRNNWGSCRAPKLSVKVQTQNKIMNEMKSISSEKKNSTMNTVNSAEGFGHRAMSGCYRKWGQHQTRNTKKQTNESKLAPPSPHSPKFRKTFLLSKHFVSVIFKIPHFSMYNIWFTKCKLHKISYLLTYSMEQSPSWEANWFCS